MPPLSAAEVEALSGVAMHPSDSSNPETGKPDSWLSLPGWLVRAVARKALLLSEQTADGVKDALLDLGCPSEEEGSEPADPLPLPPLDAGEFAASLREPIDDALRRAAALLNDTPGGCPSEQLEQVRAIFEELAEEAIERALLLRLRAAEADLPPVGADWARKYRRMMAREGRWSPDAGGPGG
jgi:hypothetical protein